MSTAPAGELGDAVDLPAVERERLAINLAEQTSRQALKRDIAPALGARFTEAAAEVIPIRRHPNVPPRPSMKKIRTSKGDILPA